MSLQHENPEEDSEQASITPEEYLRESKSSIRKKSFWAIGLGGAAIFISLAAVLAVTTFPEYYPDVENAHSPVFSMLFRNIVFLLGLFFVFAGLWGLYEARRLTLEDIVPTQEAIEFINEGRETIPYYSYILVGSIIAVFLAQLVADSNNPRDFKKLAFSIEIAGLVKPLVLEGEFWRLLTGAALHSSFLHIYFNGQAFYGFGTTIEYLSNRAHLAIVFVLAAIGGSVLSLLAMPEGTSVGASGGIMGLVGYLAIYGMRRRSQLPPGFLKSMLINIGFVVAFGLVAYQIVDNFGHLGGLLVGVIYGFLQVPRSLEKNPRKASAITEFFGMIAMGVFVFTSILSILLILEIIKF
jgi:membrane associated rhomboid family serine protease